MKNFQERKKFERSMFSMPVIIVIFCFVVFALYGVVNVLRTKSALNKEITRLKQEIAKAETTRQDYESQMNNLKTTDGIDREARNRFNLKKPGEEVAIFVDDKKQESAPPEGKVAGVYHAVTRWFKNIFSW